ncbi:hypothetical protein FD755_024181 [Muntiacus reevesi]|uniref:Retroviral envelope protein GP41-like domain-containing protein n=1 Tax=Muntiacus reevesi TaxID=9886 RepID=A0A5N3VCN9_MUNRE|nr:hypothetical protein FD755_024181 [Muntiacus reevesi]
MAGIASRLLTKLLRRSKRFIGWLILGILGLIAICTTAAITGIALQTSIQTHNFIQNWTKDAHTMWPTQAQRDEDIQDEIQELKTAIKWVGDQSIDVQKQVMVKCDWNSTQFCVTPVQFNNISQKEIFETFSKNMPSSTNLKTLAEQLADQLSGLEPRGWFQSITHSIRSGTVILVIVLTIVFVVYHCLHAKIVKRNSNGN